MIEIIDGSYLPAYGLPLLDRAFIIEMAFGFDNLRSIRKAIALSLVLTFLSITLFPFHFHLHHEGEPSSHSVSVDGHAVEVHPVFDFSDSDHPQVGHSIDPSDDVSTKNPSPQMPLLVLFAVALLLLPLFRRSTPRRFHRATFTLPRLHNYFTPPLRAPPHA